MIDEVVLFHFAPTPSRASHPSRGDVEKWQADIFSFCRNERGTVDYVQ